MLLDLFWSEIKVIVTLWIICFSAILVIGAQARDFFLKSNLPNEILSRIWWVFVSVESILGNQIPKYKWRKLYSINHLITISFDDICFLDSACCPDLFYVSFSWRKVRSNFEILHAIFFSLQSKLGFHILLPLTFDIWNPLISRLKILRWYRYPL